MCAQLSCQCIPFQPSEMGDTHVQACGLWLQHPDLNPVNYKICSEIQQQVYLRKLCNMNGPTVWLCWHGYAGYVSPVNVSEYAFASKDD